MVIIFQMNIFFEILGFVVQVYSVVLEEQSDSRSNGCWYNWEEEVCHLHRNVWRKFG